MKNLTLKKWVLILAFLFAGLNVWSQGNTISFNGTDNYIDCGTATELNMTGDLTMELWINPDEVVWHRVLHKGDWKGYGIQLSSRGNIIFYMNGAYKLSSPNNTYEAGKWQHIAFTFNTTTNVLNCYYNGKLVADKYSDVTYDPSNGNFLIAKERDTYFKGQLDEVRIWNTERTKEEIQANMYNVIANPSSETNLKAYYQFNETTGTILADQSVNSNNGTLTNMTGSEWAESYAMVVPIQTEATNNFETSFTANWTAPEIGTVENYILDVSFNSTFTTFVSGYEGLNAGNVLSYDVTGLTEGNTYFYRVKAEKSSVTGTGGMYRDDIAVTILPPPLPPMQLVFTTTDANQSIELPLYGTVNCTVDWGDLSATEDFTTTGNKPHTFAAAGTYTVEISGSLEQFGNRWNGWSGAGYLTQVIDFGNIGLESLFGAFMQANNLISVPSTLPTTVINLQDAFRLITQSSITNLNLWDVSNVTNLSRVFFQSVNFNQDISDWNVSSATNMNNLFWRAHTFNQDISNWNVSNVTNMSYMFEGATAFDQDLSLWQIGAVTTMSGMFEGVTLSTANYDAILLNWTQQSVQSDVTFSGGSSQYSAGAAASARQNLIDSYSWVITDGGEAPLFSGGEGTEADPYQIETLADLQFLSENSEYWATDLYFKQTADIDASATSTWNSDGSGDYYSFSPIGNSTTTFQSNYNGQEHNISELSVNRPSTDNIGLFGYISGAAIKNLDLINTQIEGHEATGALVGHSSGNPSTITNCFSSGNVNGYNKTGGLIGHKSCSGTISSCHSNCEVTSTVNAGGFVGANWSSGIIEYCYATGDVSTTSAIAGGFVGEIYNSGTTIRNCYATGEVTSPSDYGAFLGYGYSNTVIDKCYSIGTCLGDGFSGNNVSTITNSFFLVTSGPDNSDATSKTDEEMKDVCTFFNSDWDFPITWTISSDNSGYPALAWQGYTNTTVCSIPMQLVFTTTAASQSIELPLYGTVDCTVDWGDLSATEDFTTTGDKTHTFASAGTYTVSISGTLEQFGFDITGNEQLDSWTGVEYLSQVLSFGDVGLEELECSFSDADNLTSVPATLPSTVTSLWGAFGGINQVSITNLNLWDVSNVTEMYKTFYQASNFNQDISAWNVSKVTNLNQTFAEATDFNQDISSWDVSKVTSMYGLFRLAASFNQDISNWNVSMVTNMEGMFNAATTFNQDINTKVVNASQPNEYTAWDVSNVENMKGMFIGNLDSFTPNTFNKDISNWNVENVTTMYVMFGLSRFNQDISSWNVSKVTNMFSMFSYTPFDQDLSLWQIGAVGDMTDMFNNVTLSTTNYDAILIAWAAQTLQSGVSLNGGNSQYTCGTAANARQNLIDNHNWTITDGGYTDVTAPVTPTLASLTDECSVTAT
ncbi:MAG: BspA family leucine-rich repeat surface protein, partial [Salinivirgaceae bacterium]|nr:BspA family leucine-rich repeat surface protein [Salinivirgaceae bacterium]